MKRLSIPEWVKKNITVVEYPASHALLGKPEVVIELQIQQGNN